MKLNLDKNLVNLQGEPMQDKLSDVLADLLAMSSTVQPARMIAFAVGLVNDGEIEVNKQDVRIITEILEKDLRIINLAKAQILEEIEKLEF